VKIILKRTEMISFVNGKRLKKKMEKAMQRGRLVKVVSFNHWKK
jgi:hypothetical protein